MEIVDQRNQISGAVLRQILRYDPDSGDLFWLTRPQQMFPSADAAKAWNNRNANKKAFTAIDSYGYRFGKIFGRSYRAHRVIWALQTGEWPSNEIDHANGIGSDNSWSNLRETNRAQNSQNTSSRRGSSSKYLGVSRKSGEKNWCAQIRAKDQKRYLGSFESEIDAALAYDAAALKHHGPFAKLNFPNALKGPTT